MRRKLLIASLSLLVVLTVLVLAGIAIDYNRTHVRIIASYEPIDPKNPTLGVREIGGFQPYDIRFDTLKIQNEGDASKIFGEPATAYCGEACMLFFYKYQTSEGDVRKIQEAQQAFRWIVKIQAGYVELSFYPRPAPTPVTTPCPTAEAYDGKGTPVYGIPVCSPR